MSCPENEKISPRKFFHMEDKNPREFFYMENENNPRKEKIKNKYLKYSKIYPPFNPTLIQFPRPVEKKIAAIVAKHEWTLEKIEEERKKRIRKS